MRSAFLFCAHFLTFPSVIIWMISRSVPLIPTRASLPKSYKDVVETGMRLRMGNEEGTIGMIAVIDSEEGDEEMLLIIDMDNDRLHLPDGEYDADLVLETTTPVSFLWN